ncbi:hypothetical protein SLEP1_g26609 [Rubroshorea leprosula]|uniref:Uncharacterized protein n=1 Tax=Rubroshorea leprosula TaxID=152421 RepID=A0AAV5JQG2_9ROSI|nr:hypothetical protein SLEP1_g26609 [Rubroshorea leprosula]
MKGIRKRKGTLSEELGKVWQTSKCGPWYYGPSAAMNEPIEQETAEFSSFQQTEIKQETMCEKFEVTKEGLEDKEKRTLYSEECLEKHTKFLFEDEMIEEPLGVGNEEVTKTMGEFGSLIRCQSTTLGSEEVAMNELVGLDGVSSTIA